MTIFMVPEMDAEPWPTMGPKVARWMREHLVFGPGDRKGDPLEIDPEFEFFLWRMYEIYPQGHPNAGRRRFTRCALQLPKGSRKTHIAACVAAAEGHPDAPVRCFDWDGHGRPLGEGVRSPYIPMMAYAEEQAEDLAYGALKVILELSPIAGDFDIGLERIVNLKTGGKIEAVAGSPNARDGGLTTFEHFDESHRLIRPTLKDAHRVMLQNLVKRKEADGWALETTTMFAPGERSVAESTMDYAEAIHDGKVKGPEPRLFFFHRQADDRWHLEDQEERRNAVVEAAGEVVSQFLNLDAICSSFDEPDADLPYLERVHCNRKVQATAKAFDAELWKGHAHPHPVPDGEWITLGFDGSRTQDATGIIATHIATGYQWVIGGWERPYGPAGEGWQVPEDEVNVAVAEAFRRWKVWRLYADPPYWESTVAQWSGQYGSERVAAWWTNRDKPMAYAIQGYTRALANGEVDHDGHDMLTRHLGNACRRNVAVWDDQEGKGDRTKQLYVITKERTGSPHKIDLAVAAVLSWEARRDAIASGETFTHRSMYETQPLMVIG